MVHLQARVVRYTFCAVSTKMQRIPSSVDGVARGEYSLFLSLTHTAFLYRLRQYLRYL